MAPYYANAKRTERGVCWRIGLRTITATRLPNLPLSPEPTSNAAAEALAVRS